MFYFVCLNTIKVNQNAELRTFVCHLDCFLLILVWFNLISVHVVGSIKNVSIFAVKITSYLRQNKYCLKLKSKEILTETRNCLNIIVNVQFWKKWHNSITCVAE